MISIRTWATPVTIGAFVVMALTGLAMFFHLETPLQKVVHEWSGWIMVAGVVLHTIVNWASFKRYFQSAQRGLAIISVFVLVAVASFLVRSNSGEASAPPAVAIRALTQAPIAQVAPLFGKTPEQARAQLAAAGIVLADDNATLMAAVGGERKRIGQALAVLAQRSE